MTGERRVFLGYCRSLHGHSFVHVSRVGTSYKIRSYEPDGSIWLLDEATDPDRSHELEAYLFEDVVTPRSSDRRPVSDWGYWFHRIGELNAKHGLSGEPTGMTRGARPLSPRRPQQSHLTSRINEDAPRAEVAHPLVNAPLDVQCTALSVPLLRLEACALCLTELTVADHFRQQGAWVIHDEGLMLDALVQAAILPLLKEEMPLYFPGVVVECPSRHWSRIGPLRDVVRSQPQRAIEMARAASATAVADAWSQVVSADRQRSNMQPLARSVTPERMGRAFQLLGSNRVARLIELGLWHTNPLGSGVPDLFVMADDEVRLVEAKSSDRLLSSQLRAIPLLATAVGIPIEVVRISPPLVGQRSEASVRAFPCPPNDSDWFSKRSCSTYQSRQTGSAL